MIEEKIKKIRGKRSQKDFAELIGLERGNFPKYESGKVKPSYEFFKALAEKENINLNWLIADQGSMYFSQNSSDELVRENRELRELLKKVESVIAVEIGEMLKKKLKKKM